MNKYGQLGVLETATCLFPTSGLPWFRLLCEASGTAQQIWGMSLYNPHPRHASEENVQGQRYTSVDDESVRDDMR